MKSISALLAAAFVAGSCTVALAQASGGSSGGAAGGDQTQQGTMKDADKNPSGAANPAAGNTGPAPMTGQSATGSQGGAMTTAPASNTRSDSPQRPAAAKDAPGAATGGGGSK